MTSTKKKYDYKDSRIFLYLGKVLKKRFVQYAESDPRFNSLSKCSIHLLNLGMKHDKKDRQKAMDSVE